MKPLNREERIILVELARRDPPLTLEQVTKIFRARTGRTIFKETVIRARRGGYDVQKHRLLTEEHKKLLELVIRENIDEANWTEMAAVFAGMSGRTIDPWNVARHAAKLGIRSNRAARRSVHRVSDRFAEKRRDAVESAKLAAAPYRPGYFANSYRGPEGGPAGDFARVYRVTDA
jgi:transposase